MFHPTTLVERGGGKSMPVSPPFPFAKCICREYVRKRWGGEREAVGESTGEAWGGSAGGGDETGYKE